MPSMDSSNVAPKIILASGSTSSRIRLHASSASNNGDLGWISEKSMSNQIHNIIKDMKIGQVSKPIRRQNTVLFLKVQDIRNSKITDLNLVELKKKLINQKKNELVNLYSLSHLSKVRNTSLIEYK